MRCFALARQHHLIAFACPALSLPACLLPLPAPFALLSLSLAILTGLPGQPAFAPTRRPCQPACLRRQPAFARTPRTASQTAQPLPCQAACNRSAACNSRQPPAFAACLCICLSHALLPASARSASQPSQCRQPASQALSCLPVCFVPDRRSARPSSSCLCPCLALCRRQIRSI